jgi:tetratricopeptide (TPR) repeat protein
MICPTTERRNSILPLFSASRITILFLIFWAGHAFTQSLSPGVVFDTVTCQDHPDQSYALYIPKDYSENTTWPVIYFFEPAARGSLPVTLYQETADKYGVILVSSNTSRNGPLHVGKSAYLAMRTSTESEFNIDQDKIFTCGFSGGGRFAFYMAMQHDEIDAVIACAGPRSSTFSEDFQLRQKLLYAGLVGLRDMNYLEHIRFRETLNRQKIKQALFVSDAGHQWPDPTEFEKALEWLRVTQTNTPGEQEKYVSDQFRQISILEKTDPHRAYLEYVELNRQFGETLAADSVNAAVSRLEQEKTIQKALKKHNKRLDKEEAKQKEYIQGMADMKRHSLYPSISRDTLVYNLTWWKNEVKRLRKTVVKKTREADYSARLMDFIRGLYWTNYQDALSLNQYDLAATLNLIMIEMFPESVWYKWTHATILAKAGKRGEAINYLKRAARLDSKALSEIRGHPQFNSLRLPFPWLFENGK